MTTRKSYDRVTREDLVLFINACFVCTGQKEFYGDSIGQNVSIAFLHEYVLGNYRSLYAHALASGINHFNQSLIIVNLLATGKQATSEQRTEEGKLIATALRKLPPQRALATLQRLVKRRVNNRRTRATIRDYLSSRKDPNFDAIKYRKRVREVVRHSHLKITDERGTLFFTKLNKVKQFQVPLFESFRQAHYAQEAIYRLPFTVAEGFAKKHKIPRDRFLKKIEPKMTMQEKLRLQSSAAKSGKSVPEIDLAQVSITRLCLYLLSLKHSEREEKRAKFMEAIEGSVTRTLNSSSKNLGRVATVLDRSYSSSGSSEKQRRPLALAWACGRLLQSMAAEYQAFWTLPVEDELMLSAKGQTDLATAMLAALKWKPDLVVIVSDGYENDPPGALSELLRVYWEKLDPKQETTVIHVNPVFNAENYIPHTVSPLVNTVGIRDAEDLVTMLEFARFAEGSTPLSELEDYLSARVRSFLKSTQRS
ncbi:MAG: hypothetical protein COA78_12335 [Blastopirellula sp.]|nr:MAG: hypothetical protein COA78_12335 [Blastopirellula sp.]